MNNILFNEYKLNDKLTLKNHIVMAPMTRAAVAADLIPTDAMKHYYARRADAGLIITEGTVISHEATGYQHVPGIFTEAQIAGWRNVTDAVHQNGGLIFCQLWHVGRVSHPSFINDALPLAPSATTMTGPVSRANHLNYGASREASLAEIQQVINDFINAAKNAIAAGFDGVEIHGANGYLLDQFMHHHTNLRQDQYGQTPENMARLALAVVNACGNGIGYERVGIRLSPAAYLNQIIADPKDTVNFEYLLMQLNKLSIAYVHTGNFDDRIKHQVLNDLTMTHFMRKHYQGKLIASGSYSIESAAQAISNNEFDLVAIGRPFIANPDLIQKIQRNETLTSYHVDMLKTLH